MLRGGERDVRPSEVAEAAQREEEKWWRSRVAKASDDDPIDQDKDEHDGDDDGSDNHFDALTTDGHSVTDKKRTTYLFSATLAISDDAKRNLHKWKAQSKEAALQSNSIERILALMDFHRHIDVLDLTDPERERARELAAQEQKAKAISLAEGVWESHLPINADEKDAALYSFLRRYGFGGRTIVFCNTVTSVKRVLPLLKNAGMNAFGLHASMQQRQRLKVNMFGLGRHCVSSLCRASTVSAPQSARFLWPPMWLLAVSIFPTWNTWSTLMCR